MKWWTRLKNRWREVLAAYGRVALWTYLCTFALSMVGFTLAIRLGWQPDGVSAGAGTIGAAWVATKLIQPLRIGLTIVVTPPLARLLGQDPLADDKGEAAET